VAVILADVLPLCLAAFNVCPARYQSLSQARLSSCGTLGLLYASGFGMFLAGPLTARSSLLTSLELAAPFALSGPRIAVDVMVL